MRVNRNHFGRQVESFQVELDLPFLLPETGTAGDGHKPFKTVFIRAPVVEKIISESSDIQTADSESQIVAPPKQGKDGLIRKSSQKDVEVMARLPNASKYRSRDAAAVMSHEDDIVAVRQGNVFGTSFHPELTEDPRIHAWWLEQVLLDVERTR